MASHGSLVPQILVGETSYPISSEINIDHKGRTACLNISQPEGPYRNNLPKNKSLAQQINAIPSTYRILVHLEPLKDDPHDVRIYASEGRLVIEPLRKTVPYPDSEEDVFTIYGIAETIDKTITRYRANRIGILVIEPLEGNTANTYSPTFDIDIYRQGKPQYNGHDGTGAMNQPADPIVFDTDETHLPQDTIASFRKALGTIMAFDARLGNRPVAFNTKNGQKPVTDIYEVSDNDDQCRAVAFELIRTPKSSATP